MKKIIAIGGDKSCSLKIQQLNLEELNDRNFEYHTPGHPSNGPLEDGIMTEVLNLIADKSTTIRSRLKFSYDLAKNFSKSSSFRIQLACLIFGNYRIKNYVSLRFFLHHFFKLNNFLVIVFCIMGFGRISEDLILKLLKFKYKKYLDLEKFLNQLNPSVVLLLSSGFDNLLFVLNLVQSQASFILVINNWDNPTSKAIIPKRFNRVAVWNFEQVAQVVQISDRNVRDLIVIGSSTADIAYNKYSNNKTLNTLKSKADLLYIGQQNRYDEISDLVEIDNLIRSGSTPYSGLTYRPHPLSQNKMKRIISNMEILKHIQINTSKDLNLFEFRGIIVLPTTLLLEVILSNVPAIIYLPKNKMYRKDPRTMWNYMHFNNLKLLSPISIDYSLSQLKISIKTGIPSQTNIPQHLFQEIFPRFDNTYKSRIHSVIKSLSN